LSASVAVFIEIKTIIKTNVKEDSIEVTAHCRMFRASVKRLQIGARVKFVIHLLQQKSLQKLKQLLHFPQFVFQLLKLVF